MHFYPISDCVMSSKLRRLDKQWNIANKNMRRLILPICATWGNIRTYLVDKMTNSIIKLNLPLVGHPISNFIIIELFIN